MSVKHLPIHTMVLSGVKRNLFVFKNRLKGLKGRINNKNNPDNLLKGSLFDLGELLPWII